MRRITKRRLMILSLALYAGACAIPAMRIGGVHGSTSYTPGWTLLMWGWIPPYTFAWIANPIMLAACIAYPFGLYRTVRVLGVLAFCTALFTWYLMTPAELFVGYFLWQASTVALTACGYLAAEEAREIGSEGR